MQLSREESACLLSVWNLEFFLPQISTKLLSNCACADEKQTNAGGGGTHGDWADKVDQLGINKVESRPADLGLVPGRADTCTRLGSDSYGLTYLEGRGTRRAAGRAGV